MNLYEALIGAPPEGPEQTKMLADQLRRKHEFGVLGQLTGDRVLAPAGEGMVSRAQDSAKQFQGMRQQKEQRDMMKDYYSEQTRQFEESQRQRDRHLGLSQSHAANESQLARQHASELQEERLKTYDADLVTLPDGRFQWVDKREAQLIGEAWGDGMGTSVDPKLVPLANTIYSQFQKDTDNQRVSLEAGQKYFTIDSADNSNVADVARATAFVRMMDPRVRISGDGKVSTPEDMGDELKVWVQAIRGGGLMSQEQRNLLDNLFTNAYTGLHGQYQRDYNNAAGRMSHLGIPEDGVRGLMGAVTFPSLEEIMQIRDQAKQEGQIQPISDGPLPWELQWPTS